jgi:predicted transcriptional regulator with HTH domain
MNHMLVVYHTAIDDVTYDPCNTDGSLGLLGRTSNDADVFVTVGLVKYHQYRVIGIDNI